MEKITIFCDQCGAEKKETNHWWVIFANVPMRSMFICPSEESEKNHNLPQNQINTSGHPSIRLDVCGLECLEIVESRIKNLENPTKSRSF